MLRQKGIELEDSDDEARDAAWRQEHRVEFNKQKASQGTLRLAPKLVNDNNFQTIRVLEIVLSRVWSMHGARAMGITTPSTGLAEQLRLCRGGWQDDLVGIMKCAFYNVDNLEYLGVQVHREVSEDGQHNLETLLEFWLLFLTCRASSTSVCATYPQASVLALSPNPDVARGALQDMRDQWALLLAAESLQRRYTSLRPLLTAIPWTSSALMRLTFYFLERDGWPDRITDSEDGKQMLLGLHVGIPDSLVIEQIHQKLREVQRLSRSDITASGSRNYHAAKSGVLDMRGIPSVQAANEEVAHSSTAQRRKHLAGTLSSSSFKLPQEVSKLMKPNSRYWTSLKPAYMITAVAAWHWLQTWWHSLQKQVLPTSV